MTTAAKITLGFLSVEPILCLVILRVVDLWIPYECGCESDFGPPAWFATCLWSEVLSLIVFFGMFCYSINHLFAVSPLRGGMKALWVMLLLLANVFAVPVYWCLYIWREPTMLPSVPQPRIFNRCF